MQVSLDATYARVRRLLTRLAPLVPSTAAGRDTDPVLSTTLSHLFRLLPLTYPDPTHFCSTHASASISIRVVAVTELGLHPRGALTHAIPLSAKLTVGRLHGSIMTPVAPPMILRPAAGGRGDSATSVALDRESGKTTLDLAWEARVLRDLVAHARYSSELGEGVGLYLSIEPADERDRDQIVPVVLGPFQLPGQDNVMPDMGEASVEVFRPFPTSATPDSMSQVCLVKEDWGLGIPGKVWDSAIVLCRMLVSSRLLPFSLPLASDPITVLDLSSGTGHLASVLSHLLPASTPRAIIYCTDLPEALPLLHANTASASASAPIHVAALPWGESLPVPVDLAVCSDVLYEAQFFDALATTLRGSVKVGGKVVIGYKPRGLTVQEEDAFLVECMTGSGGGFQLMDVVQASGGCRYGVVVLVYQRMY